MSKKNSTNEIRISDFPEEVTEDGVKVYGETSYENQIAVLSHYLHNNRNIETNKRKVEIISAVREFLSHKQYRKKLDVREISDEDVLHLAEDAEQYDLFKDFFKVPFPSPKHPKFTFIDLFAGIGGFRIALQNLGGKCMYSSEFDAKAQESYFANYGEMPFGDITKESIKRLIPTGFDILCAGFPCQPFSIAGVSKKKSLGRETGFKDKTQGTLFFDVADIISRFRPKAFFLENVKNLVSHDKGNTFKVIKETLDELDYNIHYQVIDGKAYVPQHRERILIIGFDNRVFHKKENFYFPETTDDQSPKLKDILQDKAEDKYTLSDKLWNYLKNYAITQKAKGNGFGYGMADLNGITRTLSARYYKDGSEILIPQSNGKNPRKLTPRECARLMGYPDEYIIDKVSDVQAYRQFGNSVVVPLITAVAKNIVSTLFKSNK